jgi:hypothetical protein
MRLSSVSALCLLGSAATANALPNLFKRDAQFVNGEPIDASGKGGPILGIDESSLSSRMRSDRAQVGQTSNWIFRIQPILPSSPQMLE